MKKAFPPAMRGEGTPLRRDPAEKPYAFQMRHQPLALMSPDTDLQAFGETNSLQLAQF